MKRCTRKGISAEQPARWPTAKGRARISAKPRLQPCSSRQQGVSPARERRQLSPDRVGVRNLPPGGAPTLRQTAAGRPSPTHRAAGLSPRRSIPTSSCTHDLLVARFCREIASGGLRSSLPTSVTHQGDAALKRVWRRGAISSTASSSLRWWTTSKDLIGHCTTGP